MASRNREKQTAVLKRTQEQRRQEYQAKVFKAVTELKQRGEPINPTNIHRLSGVSISYLYKWDVVKDYIQSEKERQFEEKQNHSTPDIAPESELRPHSLRNLYEVAQKQITKLEAEIEELKRQNRLLRGHVAEIHELRDDRERLRQRVRDLTYSSGSSKLIPLEREPSNTHTEDNDLPSEVTAALQKAGLKANHQLKREIKRHSIEVVLMSIEAFVQYRDGKIIEKPQACLLTMIRDEAKPNVLDQLSISPRGKLSKEIEEKAAQELLVQQHSEYDDESQELKARLTGMELLERENDELKRQNRHVINLLTQARAENELMRERLPET